MLDASIPAIEDLSHYAQWVGWKIAERKGKPTKVPINPHTGNPASVADAKTWGTLERAEKAVGLYELNGVGFVFTAGDEFIGIDLDKCVDEKGNLQPWAIAIVEALDSYTEWSPSKKGVHILISGRHDGARNRAGQVEIYSEKRFFTMTGDMLAGRPDAIEQRTQQLASVYRQYMEVDKAKPAATYQTKIPEVAAIVASIEKAVTGDAEPPKKFAALLSNSNAAALVWERGSPSKDQEKWSASEWDLSLANYLLDAKYEWSEIASTLIAYRRKHQDDLKLRPDYYARTIVRASQNRIREAAETVLEDSGQGKRPEEQREIVLEALSVLFRFKITGIIKLLSEPAEYRVVTDAGIMKGTIEMIIAHRHFAKAAAETTGVVIAPMKGSKWNMYAQRMLDICIDDQPGPESTKLGQTISWLAEYLEGNRAPQADGNEDVMNEALTMGKPFIYEGAVRFTAADFQVWMLRAKSTKMDGKEIGIRMREVGADHEQRHCIKPDKTRTSRNVWKLPRGLFA